MLQSVQVDHFVEMSFLHLWTIFLNRHLIERVCPSQKMKIGPHYIFTGSPPLLLCLPTDNYSGKVTVLNDSAALRLKPFYTPPLFTPQWEG